MYLSIDFGIKNLAYIIYDKTIIEWGILELCETNANKANIIDIGTKLFTILNSLNYTFKEAIIENQIGPNAIVVNTIAIFASIPKAASAIPK
jgi:hypothetical protein